MEALSSNTTDYGDPAHLSHANSGPQANAVAWSLLAVAGGFLGLRVYCKLLGHRALWWDDWLLIAAWVAHIVDCAVLSVMISDGFGKHPWDNPTNPIILTMVRATFVVTAASWSKTSFGVTMLRIGEGWVRWAVWFIIITLNAISCVNALIGWVGCTPVQKSWDRTIDGTCLNESSIVTLGYVAGGYAAACDYALGLLPWVVIRKLQMRKREKLGVGIAMSMGIIAGIMSTVKTASLHKLSSDDSFDAAQLTVFDTVEVSVTIMAASIPAMRVLFRDLQSSARRYYGGSGTAGTAPERSYGPRSHTTQIKSQADEMKDDSSDKGILSPGPSKILRVEEVEIEYSSASVGKHGGAYEMRPRR